MIDLNIRLFIACGKMPDGSPGFVLYPSRDSAKLQVAALAFYPVLGPLCSEVKQFHAAVTVAMVTAFVHSIPGRPAVGYA